MMLEGFIRKDIEEYGLLKITDVGRKFLKKPFSIKVSLNHNYEEEKAEEDDAAAAQAPAVADETLVAYAQGAAQAGG